MKSKEAHVSKKKIQAVKELTGLMNDKRTVLIASIKNIPASQFQEISKKFREKAVIKVPKKNLMTRVLDTSKGDSMKNLKDEVQDSVAVIFSDMDPFDLAAELLDNKIAARAKPGQVAPEDIVVPAGPTDLVPGPAITELGNLGIQIQIDKGKIAIKQDKVIAKSGEKISRGAADIMSKLDIKPFKVGFIPLSAFDTNDNKLYLEIKIDKEEALEDLKERFGKALGFAVGIGYTSQDTIKFILSKAEAGAKKINRIVTGEPEPEAAPVVEEAPVEEKKEEKKEEHADAAEGLASLFG